MLSFLPMKRPSSTTHAPSPPSLFRSSSSFTRTSKRIMPVYGAPFSLMRPSSVITLCVMETAHAHLMNSRLCRLPHSKSLGSWAGVIFTAPVPKFMSTRMSSQMMGMRRPLIGWITYLPCRWV